jgi:hypothetical protein
VRRAKPMGVRIEGAGFTNYEAERLAGSRALADFLEQIEVERFRID